MKGAGAQLKLILHKIKAHSSLLFLRGIFHGVTCWNERKVGFRKEKCENEGVALVSRRLGIYT